MSPNETKGKILYFLTEPAIVPESAGLLCVLKKMDPESYRVLLASSEGEYAELLRANGIAFDTLIVPEAVKPKGKLDIVTSVARNGLALMRYYRKLFRYFRMYPFVVVHSFGFKANMLSVAFKVLFNVMLVWQFSEMLPAKFTLKLFRGFAGVFSDHIFAISQTVARQLGRSLHWRDKMVVHYRGYSEGTFALGGALSGDVESRCVGFVYTAQAWLHNNEKVFLRALELIKRDSHEVQGVVLIPSEISARVKEQLMSTVDEFHLSDSVKVISVDHFYRDGEIAGALKANGVSIFVHSSLEFEPFAPDVIECMASGIVVIGCRSGVIPELLLHGDTGILVNAGDSQAIAKAVLDLMKDEKLKNTLMENARKEFSARFSFKKHLAALEKTYIKCLGYSPILGEVQEVPEKDSVQESKKAA